MKEVKYKSEWTAKAYGLDLHRPTDLIMDSPQVIAF